MKHSAPNDDRVRSGVARIIARENRARENGARAREDGAGEIRGVENRGGF